MTGEPECHFIAAIEGQHATPMPLHALTLLSAASSAHGTGRAISCAHLRACRAASKLAMSSAVLASACAVAS